MRRCIQFGIFVCDYQRPEHQAGARARNRKRGNRTAVSWREKQIIEKKNLKLWNFQENPLMLFCFKKICAFCIICFAFGKVSFFIAGSIASQVKSLCS